MRINSVRNGIAAARKGLWKRCRMWSLPLVAASICLGCSMLLAQGTGTKSAAPEIKKGQNQSLLTKDGVSIAITYYESPSGEESPVVVLLHMSNGNRFVWQNQNGFAEKLQVAGYAVITVDLRGSGESKGGTPAGALPGGNVNQTGKKKPEQPKSKGTRPVEELNVNDYKAMVALDMEAVKKFIFDEHQNKKLNMNKMGIVGPEMGAAVAAAFAELDWLKAPHNDAPPGGAQTPRGQDVRALAFLSPNPKVPPGLPLNVLLKTIGANPNIAFYMAVSKTDPDDKGQAKKLFEQVVGFDKKEERSYWDDFPGSQKGTSLLGKNLNLENRLLGFFNKHLKSLPPSWRDRRSKLERTGT